VNARGRKAPRALKDTHCRCALSLAPLPDRAWCWRAWSPPQLPLDANTTFFVSIPLTIDPGGGLDSTGTCEGTNWLPRIAIEITADSEREREETGSNKKLKRTPQSAGSYARSNGGKARIRNYQTHMDEAGGGHFLHCPVRLPRARRMAEGGPVA
jgi:hypothetical protein